MHNFFRVCFIPRRCRTVGGDCAAKGPAVVNTLWHTFRTQRKGESDGEKDMYTLNRRAARAGHGAKRGRWMDEEREGKLVGGKGGREGMRSGWL